MKKIKIIIIMWEKKFNCEFYTPVKSKKRFKKTSEKKLENPNWKTHHKKLKWSIKEKSKKNHQKIFPNIKKK